MGQAARKSLFNDLWLFYYPRLHLFIRHMFVDFEELDDAVQEIMLKVFRRLPQYRPDYAVSTWMYAIARNHCLDLLRARYNKPQTTGETNLDSLPGMYPLPEEDLLKAESMSAADRLIRSLSPSDQQIALLRFYEEMPYRHISRVLNIPVGTLKYRVHRIRKNLQSEREDQKCLKERQEYPIAKRG
ncbi:MAG: sigma-70 family RNA polymerase sigma factor [Spirochaetales bacterium]|nr:sigma-70 family RNA polymerase sigma factor [Spirochaetales bacterium]